MGGCRIGDAAQQFGDGSGAVKDFRQGLIDIGLDDDARLPVQQLDQAFDLAAPIALLAHMDRETGQDQHMAFIGRGLGIDLVDQGLQAARLKGLVQVLALHHLLRIGHELVVQAFQLVLAVDGLFAGVLVDLQAGQARQGTDIKLVVALQHLQAAEIEGQFHGRHADVVQILTQQAPDRAAGLQLIAIGQGLAHRRGLDGHDGQALVRDLGPFVEDDLVALAVAFGDHLDARIFVGIQQGLRLLDGLRFYVMGGEKGPLAVGFGLDLIGLPRKVRLHVG